MKQTNWGDPSLCMPDKRRGLLMKSLTVVPFLICFRFGYSSILRNRMRWIKGIGDVCCKYGFPDYEECDALG